MKISVTQKHIDRGIRENMRSCPIALAIRERIGAEVSVGANYAHCPGKGVWWMLPIKINDFIREFDRGIEVKPFTFLTSKEI